MISGTYLSPLLKGVLFVLLLLGMNFLVKVIREYGPIQKLREKVDDIDRQRVLGTENEKKRNINKNKNTNFLVFFYFNISYCFANSLPKTLLSFLRF